MPLADRDLVDAMAPRFYVAQQTFLDVERNEIDKRREGGLPVLSFWRARGRFRRCAALVIPKRFGLVVELRKTFIAGLYLNTEGRISALARNGDSQGRRFFQGGHDLFNVLGEEGYLIGGPKHQCAKDDGGQFGGSRTGTATREPLIAKSSSPV